jgi:two-component system, NarL family, sensor histidine kinase DesK
VTRSVLLHSDVVTRHDEGVISPETDGSEPGIIRRTRMSRLGPILGLLFLIGPVSDLLDGSYSPARLTAILLAFTAFVAVYLSLLPLARPIACRGQRAIWGALVVLAAAAGLTLVLGAPRSFALLYVYVVAAAGLLLPPRAGAVVIGAAALIVGVGLSMAGSDSSTVAAHTLTILAIGAMMAGFGRTMRANQELRAAREELARLAVSEERLRIARDLHDLLGHTLSLIALKSDLATRLVRTDPERAQTELSDVQDVTRQALTEVREAVHGYRRLGFDDALEGARAALTAAGIDCRVESSAADLPEEVESVLAWALREASTNVVRHSRARACESKLSADENEVALQVDDDGAPASTGSTNGAGLRGIAERARRLHGTLEAGARPGGGFRLRLTMPLAAA